MFSFLAKKAPPARSIITAHINAQPITVDPKETVLQAALRQGIDFPHSCRVGGCATCKCRLVDGKVKELTDSGYLLSDDELDQGYILACQSVPQTDVRIEVDIFREQPQRSVTGRVFGQERLTGDITRLRVQLDEALPYRAGQFASIGIAALPGISRSYSFATPVQPDSQVSFLVRKVPGGAFSTLVNEQAVVGQPVQVEGPLGDFWLRPADAPLLLVAGGSGLAPLLAILHQAVATGVTRPATLLFGARSESDLYALEEISDIARHWRGIFRFIPVLSAGAAEAPWNGERGLVTEKMPAVIEPDTQAYLCGPPAMIDDAVALLLRHGVARKDIHADRFTTLHDALAAAA
ncbi:MAG: 2Fe-2S iron-sulfur cluster binding domain-containing protein [Dechloromonas sp.]|nr:2Fe-2S iron-sulfur cluster binding domain-containing protein [Dechloromonas sp.]